MAKILIEDKEVTISEKKEVNNGEHIIEKNYYINRSIIKTEFKSSIFSYGEDEKILISKTNRFNEEYYKMVLFNDKIAKAWNIIELPVKLNIKMKRLSTDTFFIRGDSRFKNIDSQISFCKLKTSTRVEEKTISFTKLNAIHYLGENRIILDYDDVSLEKIYHLLVMYDYNGKLMRTFYEYTQGEEFEYSYKIENNELKIFKKRI